MLEYLRLVRNRVPEHPIVYLDDSDVVKPEGQRFEALGIVRDGSASIEKKNVFVKTENYTTKTGGSLRQSCARRKGKVNRQAGHMSAKCKK